MQIVEYSELDTQGLQSQYQKVKNFLQAGNFQAAQVKKLVNASLYRAKLDDTNRLLFKIISHQGKSYILILEVIRNHNYSKSRFLQEGQRIQEIDVNLEQITDPEPVPYLNPAEGRVHILNKILAFDDIQDAVFSMQPPLIIVGSAGSGKTVLTLEKMKQLPGNVLYVTQSSYLTENARNLYYAFNYYNDVQDIDFLSYRELLETLKIPAGNPITYRLFSEWMQKQSTVLNKDKNKIFEEFRGVLTGGMTDASYLSRERYVALGVKQSIFPAEERPAVYQLFERYLQFLSEGHVYDDNILSFQYFSLCNARYDYVVIDEVQDLTNVQIQLILKLLKDQTQFVLCGDANQIVHPNFFSWSKVKSLFYEMHASRPVDIVRILHRNYRNSKAVNELANRILKIKNLRFGAIDRESHFLMETRSSLLGQVSCIETTDRSLLDLNKKTQLSTQYAVLVLHDEDKEVARRFFQTPLIFSVREAKGLEYENIIFFQLIHSEQKRFAEIAQSIDKNALYADENLLNYSRPKDKTDKSLEIYKFYINALYVACTRAVAHIILAEPSDAHPLLDVLGIRFDAKFELAESKSSLEEWQKEAHKLELQGKSEQADEIRKNILQLHAVPWVVYDAEQALKLQTEVLSQFSSVSKEKKLALLEYAIVYKEDDIFSKLAQLGLHAARNKRKSADTVLEKYYMAFRMRNMQPVLRDCMRYGMDFRNPFNQTPFMLAAIQGNVALLQALREQGAQAELVDNEGRTAYQLTLDRALNDAQFGQHTFQALNAHLQPHHICVEYQGVMCKIDNHSMEFLLIQVLLIFARKEHKTLQGRVKSRGTSDLMFLFQHLSEEVLPAYRQKRAYISSILSKNEVNRIGPYNRKLFLRIGHGRYVLHPQLSIKIGEQWQPVYLSFQESPQCPVEAE